MSNVTPANSNDEFKIPLFQNLVNFPSSMQRRNKADKESRCVMCGEKRTSTHSRKEEVGPQSSSSQHGHSSPEHHIIPKQNKGLCTACDVAVWVVNANGVEIKWCKGCKNFKPWHSFGDKIMATKCEKCREKQREKYAKKVGRDCCGGSSAKKEKSGSNRAGFERMSEGMREESSVLGSGGSNHGLSCLIAATNQVSQI